MGKTISNSMRGSIALLVLMAGCNSPSAPVSSRPFINQSSATEAQLESQWVAAQKGLATKPIDLNAAIGKPKIVPADPNALKVAPQGVTVTGVDDSKKPGQFFYSGCGCQVHGYVDIGSQHVYVAASKASSYAEYEFENIILAKLGYDTRGR